MEIAMLLEKIPGIQIEKTNGKTLATLSGPFGLPVTCEYWEEPMAAGDRFRYKLGACIKDSHVGPFSHPSEYGCEIAIRRFFIEAGIIQIPADNSHLDDENKVIAARIAAAYGAKQDRPRVGDFIRIPGRGLHRFCFAHEFGMQTTPGGSFYVGTCGGVDYSGSLDRCKLYERFKPTGETIKGRFWFFSHNRPGAGRGVDIFLDCRVYDLVDFSLTEDEARAHPSTRRLADYWGEDHEVTRRRISSLMKGEL
jgi:hypothetical protein